MSLDPDLDVLPPPRLPADWEQQQGFEDAREDSLFDAYVVGDLGFADRVFGSWQGDPDFGAPEFPELLDSRPADPLEGMGAAGWLRTVAVAQSRGDARFLAAIHTVAHHGGARDACGRPVRDEGGVDEVAVAMGWSRSMAAARVTLAEAVIDRMPRLHAALVDGRLDLAKVSTIARHTATMPPDLAKAVAARVEDLAAGVSCSELAEVLASIAVQLDPDWAQRRELAARARARVEYSRTVEGTADVALRDVSAAAGARIRARIEALALPLRAAGRIQGLGVGIGLARAMVAERLCDGGAVGLDDTALLDQLIADLPGWLAELHPDHDDNDPDRPDGGGPDDSGPDGGPTGGGPDDGGPDDRGPDDRGPDDRGPDDRGPDDRGPDDRGPDDRGPDDRGPDDRGPSDGGPSDGGPNDGGPNGGPEGSALVERGPEVWAGTVELRMRLSTALGLDELPAELPGSGVLTAPAARAMLDQVRHGPVAVECRLVLTDPDGHLEHVLLVPLDRGSERGRPLGARRDGRRARGGVIVELAAATTMLHALDLASSVVDSRWTSWLRRAQVRLGAVPTGAAHPSVSVADADRRFAGRGLDRYIRVRDRRCIGPFCSSPAYRAQIDHTRDWHHHGRTIAINLGPVCEHCHRLKTRHGWQLAQPEPGRFVWHTPLGQTHHIAPRPVLETPAEPAPREDGRPRPVLDTRQHPRPGPDGWIDHRPHAYLPATIPSPRPARTARPDEDGPPPF